MNMFTTLISMVLFCNLSSCDVDHDLIGAGAESIAAAIGPYTPYAGLTCISDSAHDLKSIIGDLESASYDEALH